MKFITSIVASLLISFGAQAQTTVNGAGATFPAPVYTKWSAEYNKQTKNMVNYAPMGSSGGIRQLSAKTVDFGASDDPVAVKELEEKGWYQFPAVIGAVVPVFKLKGIDNLVLDGPVLADVFMGRIKKWNDPAIAKLNPTLKLPDQSISVVVRADGSGTTAVFSNYLSQVSSSFKTEVGEGKTITWKGEPTGGKGNAGVAAFIQQLDGSIGYVEHAFAKQSNLKTISLKDKSGTVQQPTLASVQAAAATADWKTPGMAVNLNNQKGWPITAATFIIVNKQGNSKTQDVLKFFDWAFTNSGDVVASELEYVPLPNQAKIQIRADWAKTIKNN